MFVGSSKATGEKTGFLRQACLMVAMSALAFTGTVAGASDGPDASDAAAESGSDPKSESPEARPANVGNTVGFDDCESRILRIELNAQGTMEKSAILMALKSFASYPNLVFAPARALSDIAAFHVTAPKACSEGDDKVGCADRAGWTGLQGRLKPLKDIRVFCEPPQTPANKPSEPSDSLPPASPSISNREPASILTVATAPVPLKGSLAGGSFRVLNIETVQSVELKEAIVNDFNGLPVPSVEVSSDQRFAMFVGLKGIRVLKETLRSSNGNLEYRKAIQLMGQNGEVFRLIADENFENVQVDPTMGIESAQLNLVSGAVQGVALHLGGDEKRIVVLTVKD